MDREQLLRDLHRYGPESNAAAIELAECGDRAALPAILASIVSDCGWEIIPEQKIAAFVRLADAGAVPLVVEYLEGLDEAELEHDAGDISDQFWRVQTAIRRILLGIGRSVVSPVCTALAQSRNRFTKECLEEVLAELGCPNEK